MNFIVIDLETTGLNPAFDEIIEIGAIKIVDGQIVDSLQTLVKPNQNVPPEIEDLTGITNEMLYNAPDLSAAIQMLTDFSVGISFWVAHNKDFESSFLSHLLPEQPLWLDTIDIAKILLPTNRYYRLGHLLEQFEIKHDDLHRALADAQGTAELLLLMLHKLNELPDKLWREFMQISHAVDSPLSILLQNIFTNRAGRTKISVSADIAGLDSTAFGKTFNPEEANPAYQLPEEQIENFFMALPDEKFEVRTEQIEMSQKVASAFNNGQLLLSEAGTGTGKSLAYLLPAALYSIGSNQQVIISTNTINLQEQLLNKDIPLLQQELKSQQGLTFNSAVLKGRSNYLCRRKWQQAQKDVTAENLALFLRIAHWLTLTGTGDYSELNLWGNEAEIVQHLNGASETCVNFGCRFNRNACFVTKARRKAAQANLLIVNHSLLLSASFCDGDNCSILPTTHHLIIDEAHQLPAVAERQFSQQFSGQNVRRVLNNFWQHYKPHELQQSIAKINPNSIASIRLSKVIKIYNQIFPTCQMFERATQDLFNTGGFAPRQIRIVEQRHNPEIWQPIDDSLSNLLFELKQFYAAVGELLYELGDAEDPYFSIDMTTAFQGLRASTAELIQTAQLILDGRNIQADTECVIWLEKSSVWEHGAQIDNIHWWVAPDDIRPLLNRYIYSDKHSLVLTSATMANNDFSYFSRELGLQQQSLPITDCLLPSPFDYQNNAILLMTNEIGDYTKTSELLLQQQIAEAIYKLTTAAHGRTLVLFTSYQQLNGVHQLLRPMLQHSDIKLLAHGTSGGRNFIIESMQQNANCCVLGVSSFWEGVDIKGSNLSLLIIVRLPFAPPNSPILEAKFERIKEQGGNPFRDYSLPQAIIRFKQGFGRLIRSKYDRGICCVLDQRICNQKSYGRNFIEALPPMPGKVCSIDEMAEEIKIFLADN